MMTSMSETLPGPRTPAEGRSHGDVCSTASAAAATPPTPRTTRSCRSASWCRARSTEAERAHCDGARRKACAVTARGGGTSQCGPDRQRVAGHRLLEASDNRILDSTSRAGAAWSSRASCSMSSTASSSRTACGFRSMSRPRRAPRSAAWPATIPAARARCATATRATTCSSIDAVLADGTQAHFGPVAPDLSDVPPDSPLRAAGARPARASARAKPTRSRRAFPRCSAASAATISTRCVPGRNDAQSRAYPGRLGRHARLLDAHRAEALAAARQARGRRLPFRQLLRGDGAAQHIVKLGPIAVELVDRTMIGLARDIAMFRPTLEQFVRGEPEAILLVEFAEDDQDENLRRLKRLAR